MKAISRSRTVDLSGQRFGSLVVLSRAGSSRSGNARWNCLCDCGNLTRTVGTDLRLGRSKTCGCASDASTQARHEKKRNALVGTTFGRLRVIDIVGLDKWQRAIAECQCACGTIITASPKHLQSGGTVSCGCRSSDPRPGARQLDPGYAGAHYRVVFKYGVASRHPCTDCGGPASDWSYDHADENEFYDKRGRPYSANPSHYFPRCSSCHRRFDSRHAAMRRANRKERETAS